MQEEYLKKIQGIWHGCYANEPFNIHIKLFISSNYFELWEQTTYYREIPEWPEFPELRGRFFFRDKIEDIENGSEFYRLVFFPSGYLSIEAINKGKELSKLIVFSVKNGLSISGCSILEKI